MKIPTERAEELRQALETAPEFPTATYVEQLQEYARTVPNLAFLEGGLGTPLAQEKLLNGAHLTHGVAKSFIEVLASASTARGLAKISGSDDPYNFRGCINMATTDLTLTDTLSRLLGFCYADHLDRHLTAKGLPTLKTLEQDAELVAKYQTMFLNPDTVDQQIDHDLQVHNFAYSSGLLFVANYFEHQAVHTHRASEIWVKVFGQITQAKIKASYEKAQRGDFAASEAENFTNAVKLFSKSLPISYAVQEPEGYLRPPKTGEILQPLAGMNVPEDVKKEIGRLEEEHLHLGDWKTYGEVLCKLWDDVTSKYTDSVRSQATATTTHYEGGVSMSPDMPPPTIITTTTGQSVKDWISRTRLMYPQMFTSDAPKNWKMSQTSPVGSCFIAGTEIITRKGTKNIEDLAENDWILTRGEFDEWGLVSDEKVIVPVTFPYIHGFNEEEPFFTSGHVFFTTTGLRALDPVLAMKENPWSDIGRLAVGHVLLRLNRMTGRYEKIVIESISAKVMPQIEKVYGVHLREGRRSYHANGYLVSVNYPEITIKSICKTMRTIPVAEQAKMLLAFDELKPLFERFGIGGISDVLKAEVEAESDKNSMRLYQMRRNKLTGPGNSSLQFPPEEIAGFDYSNLRSPLPLVSALEGVVYVDGEVCEMAAISNTKNEITWCRSVDSVFEHGRLVVNPQAQTANGDIVYARDIKAKELLPHEAIQYLSMANDLSDLPSYEEALAAPTFELKTIEPEMNFETQKIFKIEANEEQVPEMAESEIQATQMEESHVASLSEEDSVELDPDPLFLPDQTTAAVLRPLRFNMIYDANRLKKGQIDADDPVAFGPIDLGMHRTSADGLPKRMAMLPDLDKLVDIISEKCVDSNLGQLRNLYTSTLGLDNQGLTTVTVRMTSNAQELLKGYRDADDGGEDFSLRWTFKEKLNTDVSLGLMFSTIQITLGPDGKTASGTISDYSAESTTGEGMRHLFLSNPGDTARRTDIEKRRNGGEKAGDINTGSATTPVSTPQKPPPARQGPKGPYHLTTLDQIPYKTADLEMKSRKILEDIMYYHMNQTDLNKIFNKQKPTSLPDNLAQNLPSDLTNWIKNTYSPAFTALTIAESFNTKDWQSKFTEKERAKILYFWQGDGPKCLNSSPEYKRLNQLAVRQAMLVLYDVLDQFITDDGPKWGKMYYEELTKTRLDDVVEQCVNNDQQPFQRYCNVLYVLDPDNLYAKNFYDDVVESVASHIAIQGTTVGNDEGAPWLPDACKWLADALLDPNNKSIKSEVREAFMKDFQEFCKAQGIEFERENRTKAANAIYQQLRISTAVPKALGGLSVFAKGLYYRSSTVLKEGAWLKNNDVSKTGGKLATTIKVLALVSSVAGLFFGKDVQLTDAEKAKAGGTIAKNVFDLLSPHFVKIGPRSLLQQHAEIALINDKVRKAPFGWRRGKLVDEKVKYMEKLSEESLQLEKGLQKSKGFLGRIKGKVSVDIKYVRIIGIAISVVFIAFLIWDLVTTAGQMSKTQLTLGIINVVLEVAIVICEVLSLLMPAVSIIPVIGQFLAIAVLIVAIVMLILGNTEHQKTPGEEFVEKAQSGWLKTIDDPPEALLSASLLTTSGNKGSSVTNVATLSNNTSQTIKFTEDAQARRGTPPSKDTINSASISFFAGSDSTNIFSDANFSPGSGTGTWSASVPGVREAWDIALLKPSGTNLKTTNYELRIKNVSGQIPSIAPGEKISMTINGTLSSEAGTATVKAIEKRPGAPFCPTTFTFTKN